MAQYKIVEVEGKKLIEMSENGHPVIVDEEGKEQGIDAIHLLSKIPSLQEEAKNHRLQAKGYKEELAEMKEKYGKIEDPDKALEAITKLADIDNQKLIDANEAEQLRKQLSAAAEKTLNETKKSYEDKIKELSEIIETQKNDIFDAKVTSQFDNSPWFSGPDAKTILFPEIAKDHFGKNFKVEKDAEGRSRVIGYMGGEKIFSIEKPGELASFNEAIGIILDNHPQKENIVKVAHGGGAGGSDFNLSGSKLDKLRKAYDEAKRAGNTTLVVSLERQINEERRKTKK